MESREPQRGWCERCGAGGWETAGVFPFRRFRAGIKVALFNKYVERFDLADASIASLDIH